MEAKLFHADGQTDGHDEAKSRLSQLSERAKNYDPLTETQKDRSGLSILRSLHTSWAEYRKYGKIK
jgi:hypothetical protein